MPTELQFSYGQWPSSGNGVADIEILSNVESQYNFKIRRYSRMSRRPTEIVRNDMIVASIDIISTKEETTSNNNTKTVSNTRQVSINNLHLQQGSDGNVSTNMVGTISSRGRGGPKFSYDAVLSFSRFSYKCKYCSSGPEGPQFEVRNGSEDATDVCAIMRDTSTPFDDKPSMSIVISDENVDQIIILCIAADILNERQVFGQNAKENEMLDVCCECCCDCLMS